MFGFEIQEAFLKSLKKCFWNLLLFSLFGLSLYNNAQEISEERYEILCEINTRGLGSVIRERQAGSVVACAVLCELEDR